MTRFPLSFLMAFVGLQAQVSTGPIPRFGAWDAVFEQKTADLSWRLSTFQDGKFVWEFFPGQATSPSNKMIWDGKYRRSIMPSTRSVTSYRIKDPAWSLKQIRALLGQKETHEVEGVVPNRSLLDVPADYSERAPSEEMATNPAIIANPPPKCAAVENVEKDAIYLTQQVENPFTYEHMSSVPGDPVVRYEVYRHGVVVRTEFRGTEVRITIYDPHDMTRSDLDPQSRSISTYPWSPSDTRTWREIIEIPDQVKLSRQPNPEDEWKLIKVPEGYIERSPSETYMAYLSMIRQEPKEHYLALTRMMDETYNEGRTELAKREACRVQSQ